MNNIFEWIKVDSGVGMIDFMIYITFLLGIVFHFIFITTFVKVFKNYEGESK